ncbi:hypothetical protein FD754_010281 [Muntiacus muntjak]|uniref:Phosphatidylinositol transfer protein N-terminal domain-containing protein n=1 Tax=Muntiacus muntjak TaxID=9888 RepID=A0A5N3WZ95_MUNMU|nr:hypothetical protein FD754_010281 [Muntiacus muntjak]
METVTDFIFLGSKITVDVDKMVGSHHQLNGHEFEQAPRDGDGQGSLMKLEVYKFYFINKKYTLLIFSQNFISVGCTQLTQGPPSSGLSQAPCTRPETNEGSSGHDHTLVRSLCFHCLGSVSGWGIKISQDPKHFKSEKTGRGQLREGWRDSHQPIMCSYKLVTVKFEVWGLQTRVEQFVHKVVRDILLIGHRQAFAWVDEWYDMTMDEVREFERATQEATNKKIGAFPPAVSISSIPLLPSSVRSAPSSAPSTPLSTDAPEFLSVPKDRPRKKSAPETLTLPDPEKKATLNLPGIHSSDKPCRPKSE